MAEERCLPKRNHKAEREGRRGLGLSPPGTPSVSYSLNLDSTLKVSTTSQQHTSKGNCEPLGRLLRSKLWQPGITIEFLGKINSQHNLVSRNVCLYMVNILPVSWRFLEKEKKKDQLLRIILLQATDTISIVEVRPRNRHRQMLWPSEKIMGNPHGSGAL